MRTFRLLLTVSSLSAVAIGGLVACGDDDNPVIPSPDAGTGTSSGTSGTSGGTSGTGTSGGTSGTPSAPTANAVAPNVYLGQAARFDASGSTGANLTFAWVISSVPSGSAVTTASLENATSATPTFAPDKLGKYTAVVTVTSGSQTANASVEIEAFDAPIFFLHTGPDAGPAGEEGTQLRVSQALTGDQRLGTATACFVNDAGSDAVDLMASANWTDWWEAPAGQPSRGVMVFETSADGGLSTTMVSVTSADTCATPPRVLDGRSGAAVTSAGVGPLSASPFDLPRFSPNGNRIAYVRTVDGRSTIATIGFDGATPHASIAARGALEDGGADPDAGRWEGGTLGPRPIWLNDTTVAWVQIAGTSWQVVKANDADNADNATPEVVMTCNGDPPNQFDILPSGEVVVARAITNETDANLNATDLVALMPSATKECGAPRNITKLTSFTGMSQASLFTLSPDKSQIAFLAQQEPGDGGDTQWFIFRVPADGSAAPTEVSPVRQPNINVPTTGPRWIAGGTAITFVSNAAVFDAGAGSTVTGDLIAVSKANGGGSRVAAGATTSESRIYAVGNNSCSFGYGFGSALSGAGFLGLLGLGITRRRTRKKS